LSLAAIDVSVVVCCCGIDELAATIEDFDLLWTTAYAADDNFKGYSMWPEII